MPLLAASRHWVRQSHSHASCARPHPRRVPMTLHGIATFAVCTQSVRTSPSRKSSAAEPYCGLTAGLVMPQSRDSNATGRMAVQNETATVAVYDRSSRLLECERWTVNDLIHKGELPVIRVFKYYKIDVSDVIAFIERSKEVL